MTIRQSRKLIMAVLVILIVVDLVALGILLSPLAKSRPQREADLRDAQTDLKEKELEIGPSRGMDKKIAEATTDIAAFYQQRLPSAYSQIDAALGNAAQQSGVALQNISFKPDKKAVEDLQRVEITLTISGPYVSDVKFINAVERAKVFFVINSVSLAGGQNGVQLLVNAETYFKTGAA
jgi:hypothetical protein